MATSFDTTLRMGYVRLQEAGDDLTGIEVRPPWAWSVTIASAGVLVAIVAFVFFGHVESVESVRGMLLPASGVLTVSSEGGGIAHRILVAPGQEVRPGDPLIIIESGETHVGRVAAVEDVRIARDEAERSGVAEDVAYVRESTELERRRTLLHERSGSLDRTRQLAAGQVATDTQMQSNGLISRSQLNRDEADLEQATRQAIENQQELATLEGEINAARYRHEQQTLQRRHDVDRSVATLRTADLRAEDEIVKATAPGVVDAIVVHEGETVRGGQMLLRVMPRGAPLRAICYIPERERRRIAVGTAAVIALDQMRDDRRFHGRVTRISDFLAVRDEVDATLGWAVPVEYTGYRVEVAIDDGAAFLRPGMLGDVNIRAGKVRPISLLLGGTEPQPRTKGPSPQS